MKTKSYTWQVNDDLSSWKDWLSLFKLIVGICAISFIFGIYITAAFKYILHRYTVSLLINEGTKTEVQVVSIHKQESSTTEGSTTTVHHLGPPIYTVYVQIADEVQEPSKLHIKGSYLRDDFLFNLKEGDRLFVYMHPDIDTVVPVAHFDYFIESYRVNKIALISFLLLILYLSYDPRALFIFTVSTPFPPGRNKK